MSTSDLPENLSAEERASLLVPVNKLHKDMRIAAKTLSQDEARFLVDSYYQLQEDRKRANARERQLDGGTEPHEILSWLGTQSATLEKQVIIPLDIYTENHPVGRWAKSICGIGPVIAAGLLAHINISRCPTAGHLWAFAGLDPTKKWLKGQKRPWNAELKTLCAFKLGECFVKVQNRPQDVYGKVYAARKLAEVERNEAGAFAEQAANILATRKIGKDTEAYKAYSKGKLPPAQLHARARRYAVKLFLAHLHCVWYFHEFGKAPPKPYVIEHLGHVHFIYPPNVELIPGLQEALDESCKGLGQRELA